MPQKHIPDSQTKPDPDSYLGRRFRTLEQMLSDWSQKTFGPYKIRHPREAIAHLAKEIKELKQQPFDSEECADCLLLVLEINQFAGRNIQQLLEAALLKMAVNKLRKWGPPDKDGVREHIRSQNPYRKPVQRMSQALERNSRAATVFSVVDPSRTTPNSRR